MIFGVPTLSEIRNLPNQASYGLGSTLIGFNVERRSRKHMGGPIYLVRSGTYRGVEVPGVTSDLPWAGAPGPLSQLTYPEGISAG